jgi:hypothetical protein
MDEEKKARNVEKKSKLGKDGIYFGLNFALI